jgi:hypothetical protein
MAVLAPRAISESPLPRRWMKRGQFVDLAGMDDAGLLARAFDIEGTALPAAPLHYLGISGREPTGYCMFAYPVHLHPRREQLILMAGPDFEPREDEAERLIADLEAQFEAFRIERTSDGMWFVFLDQDPKLETTPLDEVLGENINDYLPRGGDAMDWHKIMNELQMVLFDSEVNQQREATGEPTLNSLWFWGGGRVPEIPPSRWTRLVSNDPVALGMGRRAELEVWPSADSTPEAVEVTAPGTLWVHAAGEGRQEQAQFPSERQWKALRHALHQAEIDGLLLMEPGSGELRIEARGSGFRWPWR